MCLEVQLRSAENNAWRLECASPSRRTSHTETHLEKRRDKEGENSEEERVRGVKSIRGDGFVICHFIQKIFFFLQSATKQALSGRDSGFFPVPVPNTCSESRLVCDTPGGVVLVHLVHVSCSSRHLDVRGIVVLHDVSVSTSFQITRRKHHANHQQT